MLRYVSTAIVSILLTAGCATVTRTILPPKSQAAYELYTRQAEVTHFKAFAVDLENDESRYAWGYRKPQWAAEAAIDSCKRRGRRCQIYALGSTIVYGQTPAAVSNTITAYFGRVSNTPAVGAQGQRMSGEDLSQYFSDNKQFQMTTNTGQHIHVHIVSYGNLRAQQISADDGQPMGLSDEGTWRVKADDLCSRFEKWEDGRDVCHVVIRHGESLYLFHDGDYMGALARLVP